MPFLSKYRKPKPWAYDEQGNRVQPNITEYIPPGPKSNYLWALDDRIEIRLDDSESAAGFPTFAELVQIAKVQPPYGDDKHLNLPYLSVAFILSKCVAKTGLELMDHYEDKRIYLPLDEPIDHAIDLYRILWAIRWAVTDLQLSDDTILYLETAAEYLGCRLLAWFIVWKKKPMLFKKLHAMSPFLMLLQRSHHIDWFKLGVEIILPDFKALSDEDKAAQLNTPNGVFHRILYRLIDPNYRYSTGLCRNNFIRNVSVFFHNLFKSPPPPKKIRPCTSRLCYLSPEAMKLIKYTCTCRVSKHWKRKGDVMRDRKVNRLVVLNPDSDTDSTSSSSD
ncbi:hypothetical protein TWF696_007420 [Orbilia brochopaga]|uniref:Uncharacterized protein n=1 Tax=Orbilia brochopaga TaxID=3140254 RepID=A0AAV9URV7_9PEZI